MHNIKKIFEFLPHRALFNNFIFNMNFKKRKLLYQLPFKSYCPKTIFSQTSRQILKALQKKKNYPKKNKSFPDSLFYVLQNRRKKY